jgi:hypothetical protein
VTLTLPVTIAAGDVVVVFGGHHHRDGSSVGPSTSGYTPAFTPHTAATPDFGAWYKVMGASPDADVVLFGSGQATDAAAYGGWVLRNVDTTSVLDATPTTSGPGATANPDCPAITTVTDGAWVLAVAGDRFADASTGTPSNYENLAAAFGTDGVSFTVAGATRVKTTAGAEDPSAFPSWASGGWYAATLAIRPYTSTNGGTGLLTAAAGPLGGTTSNGGGGTLTSLA